MPRGFRGLTSDFLAPYYAKGDVFQSLLARSTYLTKYSRDNETWTDTIKRVVEGNVALAPETVSQSEAERLFDLFWHMRALPPGRGLWTGGVPGIVADARYNCWYTTIRTFDDWCWVANQLMLGGGVGVGLHELDRLPCARLTHGGMGAGGSLAINCQADHPDIDEVRPDAVTFGHVVKVEDSREGWVDALRQVFGHAVSGSSLTINVSKVRARGLPIRTFGGIACGPGPLVTMLRAAWNIIRGAQGRKLTTVEALDITNHIGLCIKSGNVRRSALIALGRATDREFRDAKKDFAAVLSHRHTSNNSLLFDTFEEIEAFDWDSLVEDVKIYGEPGIANLGLVRVTDPGARGVNPCGEQFLHDREACNLAEVFPALIEDEEDRYEALRLVTRYAIRQRLTEVTDPTSDEVRKKNMRIGVALGGLCDFDWSESQLLCYFSAVRSEADRYTDELGVARCLTVTTVKPSGTISLLNGSSPGLHAPYAPYYIRRMRIAKNDPLAAAMIRADVPHVDCVYDKTGRTWVFEFPCAAPGARAYVVTETIRDQFERQLAVQNGWADNAVSATLSFADDERAELAELLRLYVPRLKSTSVLPKAHGYAQAPYEQITREEYEARASTIRHDDPLVRGGEIEFEECAGGVCPIR